MDNEEKTNKAEDLKNEIQRLIIESKFNIKDIKKELQRREDEKFRGYDIDNNNFKFLRDLEQQNLFAIRPIQESRGELIFVDFQYSPDIDEELTKKVEGLPKFDDSFLSNKTDKLYGMGRIQDPDSYPMTITPNVFTKTLQLKKEVVYFTDKVSMDDDIKNHINKMYIEKVLQISELGNKESKTNKEPNSFIIENLEDDIKFKLLSKVLRCVNEIAILGRIGPGNVIIASDENINKLISNEPVGVISKKSDQYKQFKNIELFSSELMGDDIVIGRRNTIDQPGVVFLINTNTISNYVYNQEEDIIGVEIEMGFFDIGFFPQRHFQKLTIKK